MENKFLRYVKNYNKFRDELINNRKEFWKFKFDKYIYYYQNICKPLFSAMCYEIKGEWKRLDIVEGFHGLCRQEIRRKG